MSVQEVNLTAIADAIRAQEGTASLIQAKTFADRILALPVGVQNPSVTLPTASTQEGQLARIAAAIRGKEGSTGAIPASKFAERILALEEEKPSRLPTGYTEVQYIHLSGKCGFNTEFVSTPSKIRVLINIELDPYISGYEYILNEYGKSGTGTGSYSLFLRRNSETIFGVSTANSNIYTITTGSVSNKRIEIDFNGIGRNISVDGNSISQVFRSTAFNTAPLYIGSGSGTSYDSAPSKIYSCKIYNSNVLKFDFVPCTDSSGEAGLFDLVGSKFYSNSFSGTVTAGPAV